MAPVDVRQVGDQVPRSKRVPFDLWVDDGGEVEFTAGGARDCLWVFDRLGRRAHDFHVLLRHRLLRQTDGLEGLTVIPEVLVENDPAVSNRRDVSELHVCAGHLTRRVPDEPHQSPVTGIDEVPDRLRRVRVPGVAEALELTHDGVSTYLGYRLRPTAGSVHDDARVEQLAERIHVACVPRRKEGTQDRDILLR